MPEVFSKQILVMEYECDLEKRIRLSYIMRHAQQMGSDHLATKGLGYRELYKDGMVFVVNKMRIQINRMPTFGETLQLTTIPRQPKGVQFIRDTLFDTQAGERLVEVSISWALIQPETRKILRPSTFDIYGFEFHPNEGEAITHYKISRPQGVGVTHLRQIKYSDLDYNQHVNNASYADIICDALPLGALIHREIKSFGILYHKEARLGQVLEIETTHQESEDASDMPYYLKGTILGQICFESEVQFQKPKH